MGLVLIPTMELRFCRMFVPAPEHGEGMGVEKLVNVLQQRFTTRSGETFWRDVPLVTETE